MVLQALRNYGSIFVGHRATVAFSDKAIGTNHTLPTGQAARYTGGLSVAKFLKTLTYQRVDTDAGVAAIAPVVAEISRADMMPAHEATANLRLERWAPDGLKRPRRSTGRSSLAANLSPRACVAATPSGCCWSRCRPRPRSRQAADAGFDAVIARHRARAWGRPWSWSTICGPPMPPGSPRCVRVPAVEPGPILAALDAGATGVVVPHVVDPGVAAAVVDAAHYPRGDTGDSR